MIETMYAYVLYVEEIGVIQHLKGEYLEFDNDAIFKQEGSYYKIKSKKQIVDIDSNVTTWVLILEKTDGPDLPEDVLYLQYI